MSHLEGPIVDALYDTALLSWYNDLKPPFPSYNTPAAEGGLPTFEEKSFRDLFGENGGFLASERRNAQNHPQAAADGNGENLSKHVGGDPHYDPDIAAEIRRMRSVFSPGESETRMDMVTKHLSTTAIATTVRINSDEPRRSSNTPKPQRNSSRLSA